MSDHWSQIDVFQGSALDTATVSLPEPEESRSISLKDPNDWYASFGTKSRSGVVINSSTALTYSPVWQAVDLITGDISRMPFLVYENITDDNGREARRKAPEHPAYPLLSRNVGDMTADLWLCRMIGHALLFGNGYSEILYNGNGSEVTGLDWIHADRVIVRKFNGQRMYDIYPDGNDESSRKEVRRLPENRIFHLEGLVMNELGGLSIVHYARNLFGRGLSAEGYSEDYFKNGGPSIMFMLAHHLSPEARDRWIKEYRKAHTGQNNRFKFGLLEDGMTAKEVGMSAEDAMLVDMLKFSVHDVARFFNVPPHKLGSESRTSFNSVEQENRSYFNSSLGKWTNRLQFQADAKLFSPTEIRTNRYETGFVVDFLFKANMIDRMTGHQIAIQNGIKSANEVRREENLNPYDGGDEYIRPLNMTPVDEAEGEEIAEDTDDERARQAMLLRDVVNEAFDRALSKLFADAARAAKKPEKFGAFVNQIDGKRPYLVSVCRKSLLACGLREDKADDFLGEVLGFIAITLRESAEGDLDEIESARLKAQAYCSEHIDNLLTRGALCE